MTMATKRDYYEVLGVARTASPEEISAAYRRLAVQNHPDKNPGDEEAIARFKEAAEAFEVLSDQQKRAIYDRHGHVGLDGAAGGSPHFADVEDIFSAFGDIFGDLFGGGGGRRGRRGQRAGRDVRCDVTLHLHEAAKGVKKPVEFHRHEKCDICSGSGAKPGTQRQDCSYCGGRGQVVQSTGILRVQTTCPSCRGAGSVVAVPCSECEGSGAVLKRVVTEVQLPAGIDDGMRVRITGQGEPSPNGGPPGDCYCFISVLPHPLFERDRQHLVCRVPITYAQAALGTTIEVPTLEGRDTLELPPGTQSGEVFRMQGRGMPDPRRRGLGDLLVQVTLEVPKNLTPRQESLLRELAEEESTNVSSHRGTFFEKLKDYFTSGEDSNHTNA